MSTEFARAIKNEIDQASPAARACDWFNAMDESASQGHLIAKHLLLQNARDVGEKELVAGQALGNLIAKWNVDYEGVLAQDERFVEGIKNAQRAVSQRRARRMNDFVAELDQYLFEKARTMLSERVFTRITKRGILEILLDGMLLAGVLCVARFILGLQLAGHGFASLVPLVSKSSDGTGVTLAAIGVFGVVFGFGYLVHRAASHIASLFFRTNRS